MPRPEPALEVRCDRRPREEKASHTSDYTAAPKGLSLVHRLGGHVFERKEVGARGGIQGGCVMFD